MRNQIILAIILAPMVLGFISSSTIVAVLAVVYGGILLWSCQLPQVRKFLIRVYRDTIEMEDKLFS